jgi:hypothetical protein
MSKTPSSRRSSTPFTNTKSRGGNKIAARSEMNGAVQIDSSFDESKAAAARDEAFGYPIDVRKAIEASGSAELKLLKDRYRHALVDKVNPFRRRL